MLKKIFRFYLSSTLLLRILIGFSCGSAIGGLLWFVSSRSGHPIADSVIPYIAPFGTILIAMLKMIVIPVILFSLISGAASLPLKRFGRIGAKVLSWYLLTSLLAATIGTLLALWLNPGSGTKLEGWEKLLTSLGTKPESLAETVQPQGFVEILLNMFQNPFEALANNNFLGIIVFAILFGLALRVLLESQPKSGQHQYLEHLVQLVIVARDTVFKLVEWILEYAPIGVFALSISNFSVYGPNIVGPYVGVTLGVIGGIASMMLIIYPVILSLVTRQNPYRILMRMEKAIITAFITRSSAATLPVSLVTLEENLGVKNELASFSLPLGATINMDGVCVHLPMFAVLAANMFGIQLTLPDLLLLVVTTVLASIGAGGVPGGSLMLLFIILQTMGLSSAQVGVIVALAIGINPILDMFETANNVTGDMVCTYTVAYNENLIEKTIAPDKDQ